MASGHRGLRRYLGHAAAAVAFASALAGCGSGTSQPLETLNMTGDIICMSLNAPELGITGWHTPVGFTTDWYVNHGSQPARIIAISLVDSHGLILHRAFVYEMVGAWHVLYQVIAWARLDRGAQPSAWARRQPIPGAVIPTGHWQDGQQGLSRKDNLYVVAEDITATSPGGGWAAGEKLTYLSGGHLYTIVAHTGIGLGSQRIPSPHDCDLQVKAMKAAFHGNTPVTEQG
jgi:hypothetical protein